MPGARRFRWAERSDPVTEILHIPLDHELGDRSRWLIKGRWMLIGLTIILVLLTHFVLGVELPLSALWFTIGAVALYNSLFWVLAYRLTSRTAPRETLALLLHMQLTADLLAFTILLHFTGGLENPFSTYYVLLVLIGSILTTRRASLIYALLASALWIGLLLLEAGGIIPHYNLAGYRLPIRYAELAHILSVSFVLVTLNLTVAFFSSGIISRLRAGEHQLYEADQSCELRAGELARLNERLTALDRSRSMFIRLVTHELRAPVAAIQSYLRLILDGYVPAERMTEIVTRAEQRARDQLDLIGDLLDLAHAEDPSEAAALTQVDVAAILADVIDLMQVRAQDKQLELSVKTTDNLPRVMANTEHIKQVWMNLVSNAIKYTPAQGKVEIILESGGGMVRGIVCDNGIGMTPEERAMVFEPFYRTETAKATAAQGTGLGLSIVKGVITRYNGRIWVESTKGLGSAFTFELPAAA